MGVLPDHRIDHLEGGGRLRPPIDNCIRPPLGEHQTTPCYPYCTPAHGVPSDHEFASRKHITFPSDRPLSRCFSTNFRFRALSMDPPFSTDTLPVSNFGFQWHCGANSPILLIIAILPFGAGSSAANGACGTPSGLSCRRAMRAASAPGAPLFSILFPSPPMNSIHQIKAHDGDDETAHLLWGNENQCCAARS